MNNLGFLKWQKPIFCFCLFCISLFTPAAYAFAPYLQLLLFDFFSLFDSSSFLICLLIGFTINLIIYAGKKSKKKGIKNENRFTIFILLFDYWFDDFVLRKFTSFIYFVSLSFFYGFGIYCLFGYFQYGDPIFFALLLISPLQVIITRLVLESSVALIKIAENTKKDSN